MPDVWHVAGESAWNDEDCVDANIVAGFLVARCEALGRDDDTAEPPRIERHCRCRFAGSRLHFDESERTASSSDDVDLAARYSGAPCKDAPAAQAQPSAGERLGTAAALLGGFAVHFERSRARA